MGTVLTALALAGIALQTDDIIREKRRLAESVMAVAQVIGSTSTAAVTFHDKKTLDEILASLARRPTIVMACVYDSTPQKVGSFARADERAQCPSSPSGRSSDFIGERLWVYEPIVLENKQIGTLLIISDLQEMRQDIIFHALITLLISLLAALISLWISRRIEHLVSGPLYALTRTARIISEKRDYAIRAEKHSDDEMAVLIDAFNHMLARVEEQNKEHEHLLHEAQNAIRVRDEFLSIASHELRTPLTSLKGGTQLIQRLVEKNLIATYPKDRLQKLLAINDHQFTRFSKLVEDLLDVTRISSGHLTLNPESVELDPLIRSVLSQLQAEINNSKSLITLDLKGDKPGLWDRFRIEQVFVNLVSNALKYGAGKPITISTRTHELSAVIRVQDQGIGISAEDQVRLFQRFERAASSRHFGGLGLGLYITRQIIEAHGGTIRILSQPDQGTTLTVELPLRCVVP
ncbi:ATP-binding protein [Bdellovibrionota bacterium FG-2]